MSPINAFTLLILSYPTVQYLAHELTLYPGAFSPPPCRLISTLLPFHNEPTCSVLIIGASPFPTANVALAFFYRWGLFFSFPSPTVRSANPLYSLLI